MYVHVAVFPRRSHSHKRRHMSIVTVCQHFGNFYYFQKQISITAQPLEQQSSQPGGPDGRSPILVRRGEVVIVSQYVNSRKKNLYGLDADDFRPEWWGTGELSDIGWAYFPFNGGPRTCFGEDFTLMEVSYTVVRLLRTFPVIALPFGENEAVGTERQRSTLVLSSADEYREQLARHKLSLP